jgi:hypothetical protein
MATRLYVDQATTPPVSPAFDAEWNVTASALRRAIQHRPSLVTTTTTVVNTETSTTAQLDYLAYQFVSAPLIGDQTISGTLKTLLRARESSTAGDYRPQIIAKVVSGDGTTVRGTLYAGDLATTLANELTQSTSSYYTTWFPGGASTGATLSSVDALDGDRLVVEVGVRAFNVSATSMSASIQAMAYGSYADATASGSTTTTLNTWLEFSQDIAMVGQLHGDIDATAEVDPLHLDYSWNAVGRMDMATDLVGDAVMWDQRTFYGDLSMTMDMELSAHLKLNEYQWLSGNIDASTEPAGDIWTFQGLSGSMDMATELTVHASRVFQFAPWLFAPVFSEILIMDLTEVEPPSLYTEIALGSATFSMDTTMRRAIVHKTIVVPEPPAPHVPPTPDPEDPPEAAIDVTPPVAGGIILRALHGIVVDMDTPTITDGKPSS